jgi:hypothetical protein
MDIKPKICDIQTSKTSFISRHILHNTDTLVPSLYQYVETRSIEVFLTLVSAISTYPFRSLRHQ